MFKRTLDAMRALHPIVYIRTPEGAALLTEMRRVLKHPSSDVLVFSGAGDDGWVRLDDYVNGLREPARNARYLMGPVTEAAAFEAAVRADPDTSVVTYFVPDGDVVLRDVAVQRLCTRFAEQRQSNIRMIKSLFFLGAGRVPEVYEGLAQHIELVNEEASTRAVIAQVVTEFAEQVKSRFEVNVDAILAVAEGVSSAQMARALAACTVAAKREKLKVVSPEAVREALFGDQA